MSSPAAGPNSIRIPVVVDFDQATGQIRTFRRVAAVEAGGAAKEMGVALSGAEATTARAAVGMTESIGKLRPVMGTITRGLGAMGVEGAGAFSSLTRGAVTLLNTGFTPLGLAIAAATAAVGIFMAQSREAEEQAAKDAAAKKEREEAELDRLKKIAEVRKEAIASGVQRETGLASNVAKELAAVRTAQAEVDRQRAAPWSIAQQLRLKDAEKELEIAQQRLEVEKGLAALRGDRWMDYGPLDAANPFVPEQIGRTTRISSPAATPFPRSRFSTVEGPGAINSAQAEAAAAEASLQHLRDVAAATINSVGTREVELARQIAELQEQTAYGSGDEHDAKVRTVTAMQQELDLLKKQRTEIEAKAVDAARVEGEQNVIAATAAAQAEAQKRAVQIAARDAETFRGFGEAGAASITSALNQSITSGDFKDFFAQFQSGMQEAVISAFTYALIQKPLANALGDVTQGIGGLFGYGRAAGGAGGGGPAQSGTMETYMANGGVAKSAQVVNLHVSDGATLNIGGSKPGGVQRGKGARFAS